MPAPAASAPARVYWRLIGATLALHCALVRPASADVIDLDAICAPIRNGAAIEHRNLLITKDSAGGCSVLNLRFATPEQRAKFLADVHQHGETLR